LTNERWKIQLQAQHVSRGEVTTLKNAPQKTSLQDAYGVLGLTLPPAKPK